MIHLLLLCSLSSPDEETNDTNQRQTIQLQDNSIVIARYKEIWSPVKGLFVADDNAVVWVSLSAPSLVASTQDRKSKGEKEGREVKDLICSSSASSAHSFPAFTLFARLRWKQCLPLVRQEIQQELSRVHCEANTLV